MRKIDLTSKGKGINARRWDVVVLGSARPGLFAAARFTTLGLRVLVLEEKTPATDDALIQEPFFFGSPNGSPLDKALTACGIGRLERRGLENTELTYQVITKKARIDVGKPMRCASDWVAYGISEREESEELVRELDIAGRAEAEALTTQNIVRAARRGTPSRFKPSTGIRGLPSTVRNVGVELERFFQAQLEIFATDPATLAPEIKSRILGRALSTGGYFNIPGVSLIEMVRKRISKVLGEFREAKGPFELVSAAGHPGILLKERDEALLGRVLLINTPAGHLGRCLKAWDLPVPKVLAEKPLAYFRYHTLNFHVPKERIPEAMHPRAILDSRRLPRAVAISVFPSKENDKYVDLTAQLLTRMDADVQNISIVVEEEIQRFFSFSGKKLESVGHKTQNVWDRPFDIETERNQQNWPNPIQIRVQRRQPIYALPTHGLDGLGAEGEAVLGWRTAEAIAPRP